MTDYKPKLIEVALPLGAINEQAAREKSIRHGHPSTLHRWWARRPSAAARAVIWASLVDDPSADETLSPQEQEHERQRLFSILIRLADWSNSDNLRVLREAQREIDRCCPEGPPVLVDPFGGGGAIPLEGQRLGLGVQSGDLNPVSVLVQKTMLELPARFAGSPPINPNDRDRPSDWTGAAGQAADVDYYAARVKELAADALTDSYPSARTPDGEIVQPTAWVWARTVQSPDPSWRGHVPLVSSWEIAKKKASSPRTWIEPVTNPETATIQYRLRSGVGSPPEKTVSRGGATCLATGSSIPFKYIREEFGAGRQGNHLVAVIGEGRYGRTYVEPTPEQVVAADVDPLVRPPVSGQIFDWPGRTNVVRYGMTDWAHLFSPRQLRALDVFADACTRVREEIRSDAIAAGLVDDGRPLRQGGTGALAYAEAVGTYLGLILSKAAEYWSTLVAWASQGFVGNAFGRQAMPMTWDWAEVNPFSSGGGSWDAMTGWVVKVVRALPAKSGSSVLQRDAVRLLSDVDDVLVSTDPPYYDNICYADLSDFFYIWLRRVLSEVWPDELATLLTPKAEELIANKYRAGSAEAAEAFFEGGMAKVMSAVGDSQSPRFPATIYYAYKATESSDGEVRSTGWDTFLQGVLDAGMQVTATWPMRTEKPGRLISLDSSALASSIVLVCRRRKITAPLASRGEFIAALRDELPEAVHVLQTGNIAPVDLPQSAIGPGIKVFSRYSKVVEADGSAMKVSAALSIINDVLADVIDGEEAELDADTRFAVTWYSQHGWNPANAGDADGLARAKNTSLRGIQDSGIGEARGGQFRLFERGELDPSWTPKFDDRLTVWEATQHLVSALESSESDAANLLHQLGGVTDRARALTYVLFQKATDKGWADEAGAYNSLITTWPTLQSMGASAVAQDAQGTLI